MKAILAAVLLSVSLTPTAHGQWCHRPYPYIPCYGVRPYGYSGYRGCGNDAALIAGIFAAGSVIETALLTQARPRTVVVQQPVIERPTTVYRPSSFEGPVVAVSAPAVPFGFVDNGALRSPWSSVRLAPGAWAPGRIYHDANNGRQFSAPGVN